MNPITPRTAHIRQLTTEIDQIADATALIQLSPGANVQNAVNAAPAGALISLDPGVYVGALTLTKRVRLMAALPPPAGRVTATAPTATIMGIPGADAITVTGDDIELIGLRVLAPSPDKQLIGVTGARFTLRQCAALGSPTAGQHRGVMLNGDTALIVDCFIDDCWNVGRDCQAIGGWDGTKNITIENCYLGGGAQSVMFGGADSTSVDRIPTNIKIINSTLSKNPAWYAKNAQIKCALELKCVNGFVMQDCTLEYAGISEGQGAYLMVLKSANQNNTAPWTVVQNVLIERCLARYGGGFAAFIGQDGSNPAVHLNHVTLRNVAFTDIDPTGITKGHGHGFMFQSATDAVTLEAVTIQHKNMNDDMYFIAPQPTTMVLRNIKGVLPQTSHYGVKIDAGGSGLDALQKWAPDAVIAITAQDAGAVGYPTP